MRLEGTHTFNAAPQAVWDAIMDPDVMAQALPGGERLEQVGENEYLGVMNVRIGPVQGRFQGKLELSDVNPYESYALKVDGRGAPGYLTGEGFLKLVPENGVTVMHYEGDVEVGGRIANVGQRLLESTAKSLTRQGLEALDQQIQARVSPPEIEKPQAEAVHETPAGPSAGPSMAGIAVETAKDVAKDLASDYLSPEQQEKAFYMVLGALAMLVFVVLVRLVQR